MILFGKTFDAKEYICSSDGVHYPLKPAPNKLQLSVCLTSYCSAHCPFCIAKNTPEKRFIDLKKFEKTMLGLAEANAVRGISITGGEPFTDPVLLDETIHMLFEIFGYSMEVTATTNAIRIADLDKIRDLHYMDALHISRHHYDDARNRQLFGIRVATEEKLKNAIASVPYKDVFVLNCMILKDWIGTPEEAHKMLDFAIRVGAPKVAFISGMIVNKFVEEETLAFEEILREEDLALLFTRGFTDYEYCHCRDGVYASQDGRIVQFYGRYTTGIPCPVCRGLVYTADDKLLDDYGGNVIYEP